MLDHSIDKLRDLFSDAQARESRQMAALELAMMNAVANGAGVLVSKKGVQEFNRAQKKLLARANGEHLKQDVAGNVQQLAENLLSIGAKRSYAEPTKLTGPRRKV